MTRLNYMDAPGLHLAAVLACSAKPTSHTDSAAEAQRQAFTFLLSPPRSPPPPACPPPRRKREPKQGGGGFAWQLQKRGLLGFVVAAHLPCEP